MTVTPSSYTSIQNHTAEYSLYQLRLSKFTNGHPWVEMAVPSVIWLAEQRIVLFSYFSSKRGLNWNWYTFHVTVCGCVTCTRERRVLSPSLISETTQLGKKIDHDFVCECTLTTLSETKPYILIGWGENVVAGGGGGEGGSGSIRGVYHVCSGEVALIGGHTRTLIRVKASHHLGLTCTCMALPFVKNDKATTTCPKGPLQLPVGPRPGAGMVHDCISIRNKFK